MKASVWIGRRLSWAPASELQGEAPGETVCREENVTAFGEYEGKCECVRLTRDDGILLVELNSDGGSLVWDEVSHRELGYLFADIAADSDNRVVILTGCGDHFCTEIRADDWDLSSPRGWDVIYWEGRRLIQNYLDMPVPMIDVVNGPALVHAELAALCDVVLASYYRRVPGRGPFLSFWSGSRGWEASCLASAPGDDAWAVFSDHGTEDLCRAGT